MRVECFLSFAMATAFLVQVMLLVSTTFPPSYCQVFSPSFTLKQHHHAGWNPESSHQIHNHKGYNAILFTIEADPSTVHLMARQYEPRHKHQLHHIFTLKTSLNPQLQQLNHLHYGNGNLSNHDYGVTGACSEFKGVKHPSSKTRNRDKSFSLVSDQLMEILVSWVSRSSKINPANDYRNKAFREKQVETSSNPHWEESKGHNMIITNHKFYQISNLNQFPEGINQDSGDNGGSHKHRCSSTLQTTEYGSRLKVTEGTAPMLEALTHRQKTGLAAHA